jgi:hypothetical protein
VPPGYTPIGSGLYRAPDGGVYARNPQTGQMVRAPAGSQPTSATDLLTRAGISLIPQVASGLATWVSGLFSGQHTATGLLPGTPMGDTTSLPGGGVSAGAPPDILTGNYLPPLTPLPDEIFEPWGGIMPESDYLFAEELPPLTDLPTYPMYSYDYYDYADYGQSYALPDLPPIDYDVMIGVGSGEVTIANPDEWYGWF